MTDFYNLKELQRLKQIDIRFRMDEEQIHTWIFCFAQKHVTQLK